MDNSVQAREAWGKERREGEEEEERARKRWKVDLFFGNEGEPSRALARSRVGK